MSVESPAARVRTAAFLFAIVVVGVSSAAGIFASLRTRHRLPGLVQDSLDGAERARGRGDTEAVLREYRRAVALSTGRFDNLLFLVQTLALNGDVEGASQALAAAQALRPSQSSLHRGAGFVLFARRRLAEAEGSFRKVLAANRDDARAWYGLGDVLLEQDRYPEAEAALKRALALRPTELSALNSLGIVYALSGRHDEAIQAFETVMRHTPSAQIAGNLERARAARAAAAAGAPRP
jgi:tetratricopeptide (TPR) repeat protein